MLGFAFKLFKAQWRFQISVLADTDTDNDNTEVDNDNTDTDSVSTDTDNDNTDTDNDNTDTDNDNTDTDNDNNDTDNDNTVLSRRQSKLQFILIEIAVKSFKKYLNYFT